jgi:hypothetical protein
MFFGPNASGKSTALRAVVILFDFATESFEDSAPGESVSLMPFYDETGFERPIKIAVEFTPPTHAHLGPDLPKGYVFSSAYRYELHCTFVGNRWVVKYESLKHSNGDRKFENIFTRKRRGVKYQVSTAPSFDLGSDDPRRQVRDNVGMISSLLQFGHKPSEAMSHLFKYSLNNNIFFSKFVNEEKAVNDFLSSHDVLLEELNSRIRKIDLGIERIEFSEVDGEPLPQFFHTGLQSPLPLYYESDGTRAFYLSFIDLSLALGTGGVAIMDELDSDLHPHLMQEIVRWFQSEQENPNGAQLIMACHNASILADLHKEEVWLVEKSLEGVTQFTPLRKVGVRRDANLYSKYLSGSFGAVPQFG